MKRESATKSFPAIEASAVTRADRVSRIGWATLMKLHPAAEHPHGLTDEEFDEIFTSSEPT